MVVARSAHSYQTTRSDVPDESTRLVSMTAQTSRRCNLVEPTLVHDTEVPCKLTHHIINAPSKQRHRRNEHHTLLLYNYYPFGFQGWIYSTQYKRNREKLVCAGKPTPRMNIPYSIYATPCEWKQIPKCKIDNTYIFLWELLHLPDHNYITINAAEYSNHI